MSDRHEQVWTKVNAPVDRGVMPLVSALSAFPAVETIESCEGTDEKGAVVIFWYGPEGTDSWYELASFVLGFLGPKLLDKAGDDVSLVIRATEYGRPRAELTVRPGTVTQVSQAILNLALGGA